METIPFFSTFLRSKIAKNPLALQSVWWYFKFKNFEEKGTLWLIDLANIFFMKIIFIFIDKNFTLSLQKVPSKYISVICFSLSWIPRNLFFLCNFFSRSQASLISNPGKIEPHKDFYCINNKICIWKIFIYSISKLILSISDTVWL